MGRAKARWDQPRRRNRTERDQEEAFWGAGGGLERGWLSEQSMMRKDQGKESRGGGVLAACWSSQFAGARRDAC